MNLSQFIGIPFLEKGRSLDGWDCWGEICVLHKIFFDIVLPEFLDVYTDTKDKAIAKKISEERGELFVEVDKEQPGDVILLRMNGLPWHVGFVGTNGKMLHVEKDIDTVYESYRCKKWEKRVLGFYRHVSRIQS